jgi:hypothetical protein
MGKTILLAFICLLVILTGCTNNNEVNVMKLTSPVFENNGMIPARYTCQGEDVSPPLEIKEVPENTQSLALIVDDPDAPSGTWVHWVVWDIPTDKVAINEDEVLGKQGKNDFGKLDYGGPCPPSGTHRYFFRLYALDFVPDLEEGVTKDELMQVIEGHTIEKTELVGKYSKS